MAGKGSIFLNQGRRAVRCGGFLGARLRSGSGRPDYLMGVGDCMLLDFRKGFFAVADSSERNSSSSRAFMLRFAGLLEGLDGIGAPRSFDDAQQAALREEVERQSEKILGEMSFTDSCTFTGVLILKSATGCRGLLLHTGDSLLLHYDLGAATALQVTRSNFWMVGRTPRFFQVEYLSFSDESRLLLSTDGFTYLRTPPPERREDFIRGLFEEHPVEDIPDILIDGYDAGDIAKDDLALISLRPAGLCFHDQRIILGGTTSHVERSFREGQTDGRYEDLYTPVLQAGAA
ncbi:MAG: hypothetical protein M0P04_00390 [Syntrophales bacterium]|nr:hypothetical protein [Syntrophales bacterium]MDD4339040.1 hypothetical protein [Syntrophales bacterium]HPB69818.1 hypothetical protein [Syntrophales bacterium]HQN25644.1 hypothetical protein [Syntrophales bacterium]HQP27933.1 hypothetical protein [Syntrophales bacterium]